MGQQDLTLGSVEMIVVHVQGCRELLFGTSLKYQTREMLVPNLPVVSYY